VIDGFPVYRGGNFTSLTRHQSLSTTDSQPGPCVRSAAAPRVFFSQKKTLTHSASIRPCASLSGQTISDHAPCSIQSTPLVRVREEEEEMPIIVENVSWPMRCPPLLAFCRVSTVVHQCMVIHRFEDSLPPRPSGARPYCC
jgi:hypothetical protein